MGKHVIGPKAWLLGVAAIALVPSAAVAEASAQTKTSPAKGEKSCLIKQYNSEYLERYAAEQKAKAGISFYIKTTSYIAFNVLRTGAVAITMSEDTYPGSTEYFMIEGRRYSTRSGSWAALDPAALAALKQDKLIDFTYALWPERNEVSRKDVFSGFTKAYDECIAFLTGKPGPAPAENRPHQPIFAPKN
jgi:hypothetical protein